MQESDNASGRLGDDKPLVISNDKDALLRAEAAGHPVLLMHGPESVRKFEDDIDDADQVILVFDDHKTRRKIAKTIGRHKCLTLDRLNGTPAEVAATIATAIAFPLEGLFHVTPGLLTEYIKQPRPGTMTTGIPSLDRILSMPAEETGRLILLTGYANVGKSSLLASIVVHQIMHHDRQFMIFTPEMAPAHELVLMFAQIVVGKAARPPIDRNDPNYDPDYVHTPGEDGTMTLEDLAHAERVLAGKLIVISTSSLKDGPTPEWFISNVVAGVKRYGITDAVCDPWNRMKHDKGKLTDSEYITNTLPKFGDLGARHGVNVWILVHPTKPSDAEKNSKEIMLPAADDIAGSNNWDNMSDIVLSYGRNGTDGLIKLAKVRFPRWGMKGSTAKVTVCPITGRFTDRKTPGAAMATAAKRSAP